MSWEDREDTTIYRAVVNHEEQYSLWPVNRELPLGWNDAGKVGRKQEVLDWIAEVWTDMRPLSLRKKMEEEARRREEEAAREALAQEAARRRAAGLPPMFRAVFDRDRELTAWPFHEEIPRGWRDTGMSGTEQEVLAWIRQYNR